MNVELCVPVRLWGVGRDQVVLTLFLRSHCVWLHGGVACKLRATWPVSNSLSPPPFTHPHPAWPVHAADDGGHTPLGLPKEHVPTSLPRIPQLAYKNKFSLSFEANIALGEYILVPSTKTVGAQRTLCEEGGWGPGLLALHLRCS